MNLPATANDFEPITDNDSRLAVELAIQISPIKTILRRYGLNTNALKARLRDPMFRGMVTTAKQNWNSDLSVKERIKLKSQILTEDSLLSIYAAVHDPENALPAKLDAFKQLATIAEVNTATKFDKSEGSQFTVHINLGDSTPPVIINASNIEDG